jgi:hypothetical protein
MAESVVGLPQAEEGMALGVRICIAGIPLSSGLPMLHSPCKITVLEDFVAQPQAVG